MPFTTFGRSAYIRAAIFMNNGVLPLVSSMDPRPEAAARMKNRSRQPPPQPGVDSQVRAAGLQSEPAVLRSSGTR